MKHLNITAIAAVLLVGCGESQQSTPQAEPVAEVPVQPSPPPAEAKPVAETTKPTTPPKAVTVNKGADPARGIMPEPPTAKAPNISIWDAAADGNTEAVKQHLAAGVDVNAKDEGGKTPLDRASEAAPLNRAMTTEAAALLRKHGAKTAEELKAEGK